RGMLVASQGFLKPSYMLDVTLRVLPRWERAVANRTRVRIHHGASELLGRVVLLDREELRPGESAPAQLRLESPLAADRGARIVIRQYSPMRTLGGAVVLDAAPEKHKRFRDDVLDAIAIRAKGGAEDLVLDAVQRAGIQGATIDELRALRIVADADLEPACEKLRAAAKIVRAGVAWCDAARVAHAAREVQRIAAEYQKTNTLAWGIGRAELQERLGHKGTKARFAELLDVLAARTQAAVSEEADAA